MSLSEISIRRPVFAWMIMASLIIFGGISFMRMGISQLPDVDFPVVSVSLSLPGAAPEVMETDVVDVVENAVMAIQGVKRVTSTSRNGGANVSIELHLDRNIDLALQDVQAKLAEAQRKLPKELDPPVITKTNPEDQPIMWVTLESTKHSVRELMLYVQDHLQTQFATTPDVGDINLGGYIDPNMRVWVDGKELLRYQLTVNDVIGAIEREHREPPAGWVNEGDKEYNIRTMGEASQLEDFLKIRINQRGGSPVFTPIELGRVAKVEESLADVRRVSRSMGRPAVGLGIRKQRGSNAVAVARGIRAKIKKLETQLPEGMKLGIRFDSTRFIEAAVGELNFTLLLSAILTSLVCWMFLGSWSSTLNVLLAIPTSIVGTFIVLSFAGFTLNTFTLLGLSLAIGIVVDDAIMVLENIIRHREMKKSREQSALDGSKEIAFAAMAATISIVAIFLPVAFMQGIIGRFFFQFGVTMTVAVLLSLLEALTLTPMRCAAFVEAPERTTRLGRAFEALMHGSTALYARTLGWALSHRWKVLLGSFAFFMFSMYLGKILNAEFLPAEDQSRFMVRVKTPLGSNLMYTDSKFKLIEKILDTRPEIEGYYVSIGGFGGGEVNTGVVFVTMKERGERGIGPGMKKEATQQDLMAICRKAFNEIPDVTATIQDLSMRGFSSGRGYPVELSVVGPEWSKLGGYAQAIMKRMGETGLVTDVDTDYQLGMPELHIIPNRDRAAARGVAVGEIGDTINALIGGAVVGRYSQGGHRYDIRVKLLEEAGDPKAKIEKILVRNNRGELIPLSDVVTVEVTKGLMTIARRDRERAVSIFGNVAKGQSQQKALAASESIAREILPEGYRVNLSGSSEGFKETFSSLIFAFGLGLLVAYMVLASQFNSFLDPITVLAALPFSISGAFAALLIAGQSLNMYSMIGLILLMGIVKKNSILLVDFTNQSRARGLSTVEALREACPMRLRPILMTSIATVVGAIPPAMGIGPGAESRVPMAVAVIGGVIVSTLLTLYVVPCFYLVITKWERRKFYSVKNPHIATQLASA